MSDVPRGRGWAYAGAVLGGVVSIAANVAHSYVPPRDAGTGWSPEVGAVAGSTFWPVALFVAVEILARVPWPAGRRWTLLRFGGLLPVALVAAVVSYRHLSGLLAHYGEDHITCLIGPLAVDGLMVMATGALLATAPTAAARTTTAGAAQDTPGVIPAPTPVPAPTQDDATPDEDTSPSDATAPNSDTEPAPAARRRPGDTAIAVARYLDAHPSASPRDVADALDVSLRVAQRHVKATRTASVTGADVAPDVAPAEARAA